MTFVLTEYLVAEAMFRLGKLNWSISLVLNKVYSQITGTFMTHDVPVARWQFAPPCHSLTHHCGASAQLADQRSTAFESEHGKVAGSSRGNGYLPRRSPML